MSIQAANLYANVSVSGAGGAVRDLNAVSGATDKAMAKFSVMGLKSQGVGKGLRQIAGGLVKVGEFAAVGLGIATVASAHSAASFQQQMELIHTQANASQDEVDRMTKSVQDMVHAVGTGPEELAKGLYHIESVGLRGAEALDVLKASALGARLGLADMESVANAVSGVKFSRIAGGEDPMKAMATIDAIIGQGNMRMQDFVDAFSTGILGTSKTFGIGLRDMGAALAVLTDAAVPAQVAATRMQMMFTHMAAPVPGAIKILKRLGLDKFQLSNDLTGPDGVYAALTDLRKHLEAVGELKGSKLSAQGKADVAKIFGGSRFGAAAMQLIAVSDRIKTKYDAIGASQDSFAEKVTATMNTAGFKWQQFLSDLKETSAAFGTGVLPSLVRALGKVDDAIVTHRADFVKFGQDMGRAIDGGIAELEKIDWHAVESGLGIVRDSAGAVLDLIKQIPPQITVAFAGMVGIDKLAGGLLGKGAGNILGAGIQQFIGRGSAMNPMWVRMVGGIPGMGGGLAGHAEGAAAAGVGVGTGTALGLIAGAGVVSALASAGYVASHVAPLQEQGLTRAEILAQQYYTGDAATQQAILKHTGTLPTKADYDSGTAKILAAAKVPTELAAGSMVAMGGALGSVLTKTLVKPKEDRRPAVLADRLARGIKDTGPSKTLTPRFSFLSAHHAGAQDVAVAHALVLGFEQGITPVWQSTNNITRAIKVLQADAKTLHGKDRTAITGYIHRLQTELGRREAEAAAKIKAAQQAAAAKTAAAARAAGILTAAAVRDKDLSVTVNATPVNLNVNGRTIASAMVPWSPARKVRNS